MYPVAAWCAVDRRLVVDLPLLAVASPASAETFPVVENHFYAEQLVVGCDDVDEVFGLFSAVWFAAPRQIHRPTRGVYRQAFFAAHRAYDPRSVVPECAAGEVAGLAYPFFGAVPFGFGWAVAGAGVFTRLHCRARILGLWD